MAEKDTDPKLETRVALIEQELVNVSGIFSRLDSAMEKMTDISSSIKEMLAVHNAKITKFEDQTDSLYSLIEKRRNESEAAHSKIQLVVTETEKKLKADMDGFEKNVLFEMKDLKKDLKTYHDTNQQIAATLDKGKLILYGIGVVLCFILYKMGIIPFVAKF